jgi:MFS family permease
MRFTAPSRAFILLYAVAFAGMFVSFMPFIMVLLPLKVEAIAGAGPGTGKVRLLSDAALAGAIVASIANIVFGAWSDRTHRLRGSRRLWIWLGLAFLVAAYAALHWAVTPASLLVAVALVQTGINMMFAPIIAVMADEVPDSEKGFVSGLLGTAQPIGSLVAVVVTLPGLGSEASRLALVCALFTGLILPFVVLARESGAIPSASPPADLRAVKRADFAFAWVARMLVQVAGNALSTYGFFYFASVMHQSGEAAARPIATIMAGATLLAVALTIAAGRLSDRVMRRKPFLIGAAAAMAAGLVLMALAESSAVAAVGYALGVCGQCVFLAVHAALAMQLLPSPQHRGRDLGLLNLTNTLPAMVAPLLALWLAPEQAGFAALFLMLAAVTAAGGGVALAVRSQA